MKQFLLSCVAVFVGFLLVWVSALSVGRSQSFATELPEGVEGTEASAAAEAAQSLAVSPEPSSIDYYLPYPGILPDHSLYFLKMFRDRVKLITTGRGEAKAELLLLYADKRIGATQALVQGGKATLGARTAIKAEGYLRQAVEEASQLNKEEFLSTISQSSLKHREVLVRSKQEQEGAVLQDFDRALETNKLVLDRLGIKVPEDDEFLMVEETEETEEEEPGEMGEEYVPVEIGL